MFFFIFHCIKDFRSFFIEKSLRVIFCLSVDGTDGSDKLSGVSLSSLWYRQVSMSLQRVWYAASFMWTLGEKSLVSSSSLSNVISAFLFTVISYVFSYFPLLFTFISLLSLPNESSTIVHPLYSRLNGYIPQCQSALLVTFVLHAKSSSRLAVRYFYHACLIIILK